MTDRISHEEARKALESNDVMSASAHSLLCDYIEQQRAAEVELTQRLARVAELAHDRDDDSHEWRSRRLGQCASITWSAVEAHRDKAGIDRAVLKWTPLAHQLAAAETKLTALQAEHEAVVNRWSLKLSASEARVAELEAATRDSLDDLDDGDAQGCAQTLRRALEPASPPSVAEASVPTYQDWLRQGEEADLLARRAVESVQPAPGGVERCRCCGAIPGELFPTSRFGPFWELQGAAGAMLSALGTSPKADEKLESARQGLLAALSGRKPPLKLLITNDWLMRRIAIDRDFDTEAGASHPEAPAADPPKPGGVEREPWRFYEEFPGKPGPTPAESQGYINNPHFDRYVEQVTGHTLVELPKRFHGYLHTAFGEGKDASLGRYIRQREESKTDYVTRGELVEAMETSGNEAMKWLARELRGLEKARKP